MSDLSLFFAGSALAPQTEDFVVSERFKDKEGRPIPWQVRPISEEENDAIRTSATRKVKGKNGVLVPETNYGEYLAKLAAACVVFPNLNDAELQKSYGVRGADTLIRKMLLSGEYANLVAKIQEINGFDKDINELADEVKN
ncbi:phage tail assembly chaperone [Paenibacillus ginsengihumi]|uniref:phage tail assembly chaperone n=1 Tax=Paenibacillus ginsengihumi TaxID=431596 RepID=UPI000365D91F|nr:phage portal protein [Paenibacillus ginsengihumi]